MRRIVHIGACVATGLSMFLGISGCAQNKAGMSQKSDPVIQNYMRSRSELVAQRRRLAATYGATSPTVAQIDRQIQLVDKAMAERQQQLIEQENARREVQRMKQEAAPMESQAPASQPS